VRQDKQEAQQEGTINFHEEIAKVAYGLYEKNVMSRGHELDHWLEAERIITAWHKHQKEEKQAVTMKKPKVSSAAGRSH